MLAEKGPVKTTHGSDSQKIRFGNKHKSLHVDQIIEPQTCPAGYILTYIRMCINVSKMCLCMNIRYVYVWLWHEESGFQATTSKLLVQTMQC